MDIGKRIIELREQRNITTNRLAYLSGLSQSFLRSVELGEKNISVSNLAIICTALNVTLCEFFNDSHIDTTDKELTILINKLTCQQRTSLLQFLRSILPSK